MLQCSAAHLHSSGWLSSVFMYNKAPELSHSEDRLQWCLPVALGKDEFGSYFYLRLN